MKKGTSKKTKLVIGIIILSFIGFKVIIQINHIFLPLTLIPYSVQIKTPDVNNPTIKVVTFRVEAINKNKKAVDVKFHFTKEKDTSKWYAYYDTIPATYITEIYHIEPDELKSISSEIVVETDDERLVTSLFRNVDIQYEIIK